jgi:hypothetical protein
MIELSVDTAIDWPAWDAFEADGELLGDDADVELDDDLDLTAAEVLGDDLALRDDPEPREIHVGRSATLSEPWIGWTFSIPAELAAGDLFYG